LVGISALAEATDYSADSLWQLVAAIQRATLRLHEGVDDDSLELSLALKSCSFLQELIRSSSDLPNTVVIRQPVTVEEPVELLQQFLQALESGERSQSVFSSGNRNPSAVFESLTDSIHGYLKASIQSRNRQRLIDQSVQRSMYDFAYGLSHEINNPLANISARAAELAARATSDRERKSLQTIVDQAMKAHEMLAEMMLAVKTPALNMKAGDVRKLLTEIAHEWKWRATERSIDWKSEICDEFLWSVFDCVALSEAIQSGIRNALEACRSGDSVTLIGQRSESAQGDLEIRIAIIDNGPGLTLGAMHQAWNLYYSGREAGRGLGIGLAKTRRVIDLHRGRVWLDSKPNQGCAMEIRLPWKRVASVA
jgi:signal transduction histidine kinase